MKQWREAINELLGARPIPDGAAQDAIDDGGYRLDGLLYQRHDPMIGVVAFVRDADARQLLAATWQERPNRVYLLGGRRGLSRRYYDMIRGTMIDHDYLGRMRWTPSDNDGDWVRGWEVWVRR